MPVLNILDSLRRGSRHSVTSDFLRASSILNVREGESIFITYTSASDKMKVFASFIRDGLENGDAVWYGYPDEEDATVKTKLKEYGIDVEKYAKDGALVLYSLTQYFMPNGKLDYEQAILENLRWWVEVKKRGYKHVRNVMDLGDFSFVDGNWQKFISDYWFDPRWDDPKISEWAVSEEAVGVVFVPFIMEVNAINVEHMPEQEVNGLLRAFGRGELAPVRFIDLIEDASLFSGSIGLDHERSVGCKILLEYDPVSNYESVANCLARESMANVEPVIVFTSKTSPLYMHLAEQPAIRFFLTSISASTPQVISKNEMLLPAKSPSLVLDALSKVLETYADAKVCIVFDILSELLTTMEPKKAFIFLRQVLDMLASERVTVIFLLNTNAHEPEVVSQIRGLFSNLLTYDKDGTKVVKLLTSQPSITIRK